jgi:hypothetical protein
MPKKKSRPNKAQRRADRLRKARAWVQTYDGQHLARAYKEKFGIDPVCAINDMEEIGAIPPEEAARLREVEAARQKQLRREREKKQEQAVQGDFIPYIYDPIDVMPDTSTPAEKPRRAGKNHEWVGGQLLQTNKKWSHLKQQQKIWIQQVTAEEHAAYIAAHDRLPMKKGKEAVLGKVHDRVNERGIWIPYGEFAANVGKMIDRLNRKRNNNSNNNNND